jgi:hypothetical protein
MERSRRDVKANSTAALTQAEFDELRAYVTEHKDVWPSHITQLLERLLALYRTLAQDKRKAAEVVKTLRMAMGIIPKSERGAQLLSPR